MTRIGLGAAAVLLILACVLGALILRRVEVESLQFLAEEEKLLDERVRVALAGVEILERAALDALSRPVEGESLASVARRVEDDHPIARRVFIILGDAVEWPPRAAEGDQLGPLLWLDAADDPAARRFLGRADEKLAAGDREGALALLERGPERPLSTAARAEAELRRAAILAEDPTRDADAFASLDLVIGLVSASPEGGTEDPPWALAARLRKGLLLIERGFATAGSREFLRLLADLARGDDPSRWSGPRGYLLDRSLEALALLASGGKLDGDDGTLFRDLRSRVERLRAEAEFRSEVEREILPRLRVEVEMAPGPSRWVSSQGGKPDVIVLRDEGGDPRRVAGFRADASLVLEGILMPLAGAGIRDEKGVLLAGGDSAGGERVSVRAGDLPWTIEVPAGDKLKSFRSRRYLLYGGGLLLGLGLVSVAAWASLRGMARQIELADLKSRFVADVSHELKTPLTVIRMFSELLRLGYAKRPEDVEKGLDVIARETDHLGLLIDNVLEASRIEAGEKEYHREPSDAGVEARRVVDEFRPYAEHKGFTVRFTEEGPLPAIDLDRLAFPHALRNLLSNAVKYSADAREIDVRARVAGEGVAVEVADRGVGLDGVDAGRLFDRFYRAPPEPGRPIAGAGLGLALVKHVAEGHGGMVEARGREGGGSVFVLWFPGSRARGDG